jgi:hypothetical protein
MNEIKLKAEIFDIIAETEQKQYEISVLHEKRLKLLKELEDLNTSTCEG